VPSESPQKRIFTYAEATSLVPAVRRLTEAAVRRVDELTASTDGAAAMPARVRAEVEATAAEWARSIMELGVEVKGLWLVDFDNGSGYYCWHYPEAALQFYHSYEDGFRGRIPVQ
jgi:hypothetical protein